MRRAFIVAFCAALVLTGVGGYIVVTKVVAAVMGAIGGMFAALGASLAAWSMILGIPVFVAFVLLASGADWFTLIEVVRRTLRLLGVG